jgi:hypothetical protein
MKEMLEMLEKIKANKNKIIDILECIATIIMLLLCFAYLILTIAVKIEFYGTPIGEIPAWAWWFMGH